MKSLLFSTTLTLFTIVSMTSKAQSYEVLSIDDLKNTVETIYYLDTLIKTNQVAENKVRLLDLKNTVEI